MKKEEGIFDKFIKIEVSIINKDNQEYSIISSVLNVTNNNEKYMFAKKACTILTNTSKILRIKTFTICYKFNKANLEEYKDYLNSLKISNKNHCFLLLINYQRNFL